MKSVLVIETPKNCLDCQLMVDGWCYAVNVDRTQDTISAKDRTCWCPLRPLPKRKDEGSVLKPLPFEVYMYRYGFNECLDEIVGETE